MRIGIVGINHKLADLKLRETLATICQKRFGHDGSIHGAHFFILLSTCNRTEVYFSSEDLAVTHTYLLSILRSEVSIDFEQKLYSFFGIDCFLHLCRVTAGLDSAVIAETEIQGQVKSSYQSASQHQQLPYELHYLFQKSLAIAKKIRTELPLRPGLPHLEYAIYSTGQHLFPDPENLKVLFVGASDINEKIISYFKSKNLKNIFICNRSLKNAEMIAKAHQIQMVPWEELVSCFYYDWIIFGTKAPEHLITSAHVPSKMLTRKLFVDLSVPRNVDPCLGKNPGIILLNIDQINQRLTIRNKSIKGMLEKAEELASHAASQQVKRFREKAKPLLRLIG